MYNNIIVDKLTTNKIYNNHVNTKYDKLIYD